MIPHLLLERIRRHLNSGGIIAYPTESCYGLGCDPKNYRAIRLLLGIKQRSESRGLILVAGDMRQLQRYIGNPPPQEELARFWPGPYTLLLDASRRTPPWIRGRHDKVALRLTAHPDTSRLCRMLGMALVSTSANLSGMKPAGNFRDCTARFGKDVLVVPGRTGKRKTPSTIVDFESGRIFRP